jgi:hypothetical protein
MVPDGRPRDPRRRPPPWQTWARCWRACSAPLAFVVTLSCLSLLASLAALMHFKGPLALWGQRKAARSSVRRKTSPGTSASLVPSSFAEFVSGHAAESLTVAVVGNGEISEADRGVVDCADMVIRFNDCSYFRKGDKTSLRVVRHPFPLQHELVHAPVWHVAPHRQLCESHRPGLPLLLCSLQEVEVFSPVYQSEYGSANELDDKARIFPGCDARDSNLHAKRYGGPSSGGLVLSELEQTAAVARIHVVGMNWNGNPDLHIDFANSSLVKGCCRKCSVHATGSTSYGNKSKLYFAKNPDSFYQRMMGAK